MSQLNPAALAKIEEKAIQIKAKTDAELKSQEEVVDTGADVIEVIQIAEVALGDGVGFEDILAALKIQPIVKEVWGDFAIAIIGVKSAEPIEMPVMAMQIAQEAKRRGPVGPVSGYVINGLYGAAKTYENADAILHLVNSTKDLWINIVKGEYVVPPLV